MTRKDFIINIRGNLIDNYSEEMSYRQLTILLEVLEDLGLNIEDNIKDIK